MTSIDCLLDTTCDVKSVQKCHSKLKQFTTQTIKLVDEIKAFLELEKPKVNKMWQLSVKLKLLTW